ncbi:uncharacterized protein V2V93DRAFT_362625 [Kockiozyma suomiensis]|uniref:uncharacterized protein n=1 Tax=Kockiozyma suomiensis TaxID=1337062 RepID=UPI0033433182
MSTPSSGTTSPAFPNQVPHDLPLIVSWDVEDVGAWLDRLGLSQYKVGFADNEITGDVLIHLDHDFLKELGVSAVGHRLTILKAVYQIKRAQDIPIEPGQFVPLTEETHDKDFVEIDRLVRSLELRDRRIQAAEYEIRRLAESYARLREDMLPLFKLVKESKPLPTPEFPQHQPSLRHSMFIPSSQPSFSNPHGFPSSAGSTLSRKLSTKKSDNESSSHVPDWLDQSFIPPPSSSPSARQSFINTTQSLASFSTSTPHSQQQQQQQTDNTHSMYVSSTSVPARFQLQNPPSSNLSYRRVNSPPPPLVSPTQQQQLQSQASQSMGTLPISNSSSSSLTLSEAFKRFKFKQDDPCYKVLPTVLKGHRINDDWRQYALLVCFGDQERLLGLDEKPLGVLKELQDQGKQPVFMLRPIQGGKHEQGAIVTGTPGGVL